ncbi:four-carbon acid sugar kinase family protein [Defluviitalea phaphyphila]|uniref:four-carbon acid sugar kinase family protein n=1 Tax=Defluviitalea phaphyphila TaxID=1473580 RepID=UPI000730956A|nr:four-carbon acid sugar kinase family protein [Defluviitalea phaphyphila]
MLSTIVIADDLTGANATGVLLKNLGEKVLTILSDTDKVKWENIIKDYDGIVISTDSRGDEPQIAYDKVYKTTKILKNYGNFLFNKRIDSTLRGNIGAEIDGMMDALGENYVAFVIPAYPKSDRKCLGGFSLVEGVILQNTDVAKDPKSPVYESNVRKIVNIQSKRKTAQICIDVIETGYDYLVSEINKNINSGAKIIIFDSMTDEHIKKVATAVTGLNIPYFTVCPGPFIRETVRCVKEKGRVENKAKILLTIGSVTKLSHDQICYLMNKKKVLYQKLDVKEMLYANSDEQIIQEIVNSIKNKLDQYSLVCLTTTDLKGEYHVDLKKEAKRLNVTVESISKRINNVLAQITKCLINEDKRFKGLFSSGGDTTLAIANSFNSEALEIEGEVYPLAVSGTLINEKGAILDVITKGGMIGEEDGLVKVVDYLMERIAVKERNV